MRALADATRIQQFMKALGREADRPAHAYPTGGATAVLYGWRESTIDVDMKMVPDLDRVFRAIPEIKERLQIRRRSGAPYIRGQSNGLDKDGLQPAGSQANLALRSGVPCTL